MANELRITDTNSADDSSGAVWGIEGNLFWWIIGGAFISVMVMLLLFSIGHQSFTTSLAMAAVPMTTVLLYVFAFKQGKPPYYDVDCLEWALSKIRVISTGFAPKPRFQPKHPLSETKSSRA